MLISREHAYQGGLGARRFWGGRLIAGTIALSADLSDHLLGALEATSGSSPSYDRRVAGALKEVSR